MPSSLSRSLLAGLVSLAFAAPASAAVVVNFVETGTGVNASFLGSLDLTGEDIGPPGPGGAPFSFINPNSGVVVFNTGVARSTTFIGTPAAFGSGGFSVSATTVDGDVFGLLDGSAGVSLQLPVDFSSTKILTGSMTFAGATFASLGIAVGTFVTQLPLDTITVITTPIPEPGSYALMLAGLGVVAFAARRRKNQMKGAPA
jgi:PEP-CTERM motif